jgi:glycosyltransferase involved in cell wall biosynthesis
MYLARHGNYMGVYPKPRAERNVLRAKYGFDDSHRVLLAFGQIRAPKRLIELATEFERYSPASTRLIIAGAAKDPDITRRLKVVTDASDRIVLLDRYIPDPEVGELYALADLAVFNYAEIFSSGALLLALSLGCAVLAPRRGAAEEAFESPALFMWETSPLEVLSAALAVSADIRGRAALAAAESHTWVDSARVHMRAYEGSPPDQ